MKYYAVKVGRQPGVYTTWTECQAQTSGYKGAVFKSFSTLSDAQTFVSSTVPRTMPNTTNEVVIYTDGSHQRNSGYLGIGAYCRYQGVEYRMSKQCTRELLSSYGISSDTCSNPTAEFIAFTEILRTLGDVKVKLLFKIDYIGVGHWVRNEWKAKEPHIRLVKAVADTLLKGINCTIEYVKGHSGDPGNDEADTCAGDTDEYNEFVHLAKLLR